MKIRNAFFVLLTLLAAPALATTMCAEDDVIAIVLDPTVNGTNYTYNADLFEWSAVFPYGTVWGIATCLDKSGTGNVAVSDLRDTNGELVVGGERTGVNCWCKMTHPASSLWVFRNANGSVADCRSNCANNCGNNMRDNAAFRGGVFGSLGSLGNGTDIQPGIKVLLTCRTKCKNTLFGCNVRFFAFPYQRRGT